MGRTLGVLMVGTTLRLCSRDPAPVPVQPAMMPAAQVVPGTNVVLPAPQHGGRVQLVGTYALETVAARTGGVALFWTDLEGHPIPPSAVVLRTVRVEVGGRPRTVPVRLVNGAFVASVAVPASASVVVTVPRVEIYHVAYEEVVAPDVVVVAALPGILVVPTAPVVVAPVVTPVVVFHGKHRKFRRFHGWH